jgi:hypothetical protein
MKTTAILPALVLMGATAVAQTNAPLTGRSSSEGLE